MFSHEDTLTIFLLTIVVTFVMAVLTGMYVLLRRTKYDESTHRIELEMMRRSLESQIYSLNDKLLATESRWRDVNHLLVSSQNSQKDVPSQFGSLQLTSFLESAGLAPEDLVVDDNLIFVLTPFHPRYRATFEAISLACQELGLRALRGDEQYIEGDVFSHIVRLIARARLVIANIEGRNPNVYYELGIAQGLGKQTMLVSQIEDDAPFDLRARRLVLYASADELRTKVKDEIARTLFAKR